MLRIKKKRKEKEIEKEIHIDLAVVASYWFKVANYNRPSRPYHNTIVALFLCYKLSDVQYAGKRGTIQWLYSLYTGHCGRHESVE